MTGTRLAIDRLRLSLDGFETAAAEQLGGALERALRERVARLCLDTRGWGAIDLARLDLGELGADAGPDHAALAGVIADRLVDWLARHADEREA
jgi:hypothetical protein